MTTIAPISRVMIAPPRPPPPLAAPVPPDYGASPQQASQSALSRMSTKYAYDNSNLASAEASQDRMVASAKSAGRHITLPRDPPQAPAPIDEQRNAVDAAKAGNKLDVTA